MAVFVETLLCDEDFLDLRGEDWRITRYSPVEHCVESEVLPCLRGPEPICHRFTDAGGEHGIQAQRQWAVH